VTPKYKLKGIFLCSFVSWAHRNLDVEKMSDEIHQIFEQYYDLITADNMAPSGNTFIYREFSYAWLIPVYGLKVETYKNLQRAAALYQHETSRTALGYFDISKKK
ncbi:MAG: hypothetical protein AAB368_16425, partial [bacterium]